MRIWFESNHLKWDKNRRRRLVLTFGASPGFRRQTPPDTTSISTNTRSAETDENTLVTLETNRLTKVKFNDVYSNQTADPGQLMMCVPIGLLGKGVNSQTNPDSSTPSSIKVTHQRDFTAECNRKRLDIDSSHPLKKNKPKCPEKEDGLDIMERQKTLRQTESKSRTRSKQSLMRTKTKTRSQSGWYETKLKISPEQSRSVWTQFKMV